MARSADPRYLQDYEPAAELSIASTKAAEALASKDYEAAVRNFSAALALTPAGTHVDALRIGGNNVWFANDPRRKEAADLYAGRAQAHTHLEAWDDALRDALALNHLSPDRERAVQLFAQAAEGCAGSVKAAAEYFGQLPSNLPDGVKLPPLPPGLALQMTHRACHGLVADAYTILAEDVHRAGQADASKGDKDKGAAALKLRDEHIRECGPMCHPLAKSYGASETEIEMSIFQTVEGLLGEPGATSDGLLTEPFARLDPFEPYARAAAPAPRAAAPPHAVLLSHLIALTLYRLGCREAPLKWRPAYLTEHLKSSKRLVEVWLRVKLRQFGEKGELTSGSEVRIEGLQSRAELNGKVGRIVSYDARSRPPRYGVAIDGVEKPLALKEENVRLVIEVGVDETCDECAGDDPPDTAPQEEEGEGEATSDEGPEDPEGEGADDWINKMHAWAATHRDAEGRLNLSDLERFRVTPAANKDAPPQVEPRFSWQVKTYEDGKAFNRPPPWRPYGVPAQTDTSAPTDKGDDRKQARSDRARRLANDLQRADGELV